MAKDNEAALLAQEALDSARSAHKRLDEFGEAVRSINSIAISVEKIAGRVDVAVTEISNTNRRVDKIEACQEEEQKRPRTLSDRVKENLITGVCMIVIGALMALIIK